MGTFSQFSVARELLQRGELEQALAAVDDLRSVADHRVVGLFGKSVEALELEGEIWGVIIVRNQSPEEESEIYANLKPNSPTSCAPKLAPVRRCPHHLHSDARQP
jgi:hypothetical protein